MFKDRDSEHICEEVRMEHKWKKHDVFERKVVRTSKGKQKVDRDDQESRHVEKMEIEEMRSPDV